MYTYNICVQYYMWYISVCFCMCVDSRMYVYRSPFLCVCGCEDGFSFFISYANLLAPFQPHLHQHLYVYIYVYMSLSLIDISIYSILSMYLCFSLCVYMALPYICICLPLHAYIYLYVCICICLLSIFWTIYKGKAKMGERK